MFINDVIKLLMTYRIKKQNIDHARILCVELCFVFDPDRKALMEYERSSSHTVWRRMVT